MRVGLLAGTDELHFRTAELQLGRTEVLEDRHMRTLAQPTAQRLGHGNAAAHHNHIDILGRTLQKNVANVSAYHVAFQPKLVCRRGYLLEYIVTETLFQFFRGQLYHILSFKETQRYGYYFYFCFKIRLPK